MDDPTRQEQLEAIFEEAYALPSAEEREAFVAQACGDDQALREEILELLNSYDLAGKFLAKLPSTPMGGEDDETVGFVGDTFMEGPGTVVGRYTLLRVIGEGGMGTVYLAEQKKPIQRKVALKIIKPGMDSKQVIARFDAERQAMARMDHPNICKIFDAGATKFGRPYFVMEAVDGRSITRFCDEEKLTIEQRLELFLLVLGAVQHAHERGVIHRDLKPSNILIAQRDGWTVPYIIDFGIAKAMQGKLTEQTLVTHYGQFLGTPAYMSPEQATKEGDAIDARSDVFSLGAVLYELIAGSVPLRFDTTSGGGYALIVETIVNAAPPTPSTQLSSLPPEKRTAITENRKTDWSKLKQHLQGDLDWIVMKAMEKDPKNRYPSAQAMAEDMMRHLNGETLFDTPNHWFQQILLFARRYPLFVSMVTLLLMSIAIILSPGILKPTTEGQKSNQEHVAINTGLMVNQVFPDTAVEISDPGLELAIRMELGKQEGNITTGDMENLTSLDASREKRGPDASVIRNLSGLENAINLNVLFLSGKFERNVNGGIEIEPNIDVQDFSILADLPFLTHLSLNGNLLKQCDLPTGLMRLQHLDIAGNSLTHFTFPEDMVSLQVAFFNYNKLTSLLFPDDFSQLKMIQVAENSLTNIQFPEKMPNLSSLYLGRNKLTQIQLPQDLGQLTSLSLARNQLSSWRCPEALFNARTISLGGNPLQSLEIPKGMRLEIFELSQINQNIIQFYGSSKTPTKIDVPDPGLDKAIRRALDQPVGMLDEIDLERLVMLDATMDVRQGIQPIRNLQGLENAVNLEELNLETFGNVNIVECDLTPLTDLKWFRHLNLGNNQLRTIRIPGIMSQIKTFIGHGNPFTDFTFLSSMPNLKSLYLSASNLKDVHTGSIAELLALERLDLAGNQISDIGFLDALINLRVLSLAHNPLENGNLSFSNLSSDLKRLYLNDCGLKSVHFPDTPTSLRYLSLKSNELTVLRLPESMSQLKTLDLSNNNIKTLILPKHTSQMRNILLNGNPIQLLQASDSTNFREIQFTSISDDCKVKLVPSGRNYNFGDVKNFGPPLQTAVGDDSPAWPKASKEGLIGWYLFQRGANDLSGQGNDGQMHEVVPIEDRFGNMTSAFWFNGKTSYIEIPSMSQRSFVNKTYTFSFWATPRRLPAGTNLGAVISKWESEPKPNKDLLELQTFRINLRVIGGDSTSFKGLGFSMSGHQGVGFGGETPPYNRAWDHHVVVCDFKDGVIRTYINGDLSIDTKAQKIRLNVNQQDNATPFILGHIAGQRAEGEGYYGGLDDVRIFDRALTAEEVKSLYELEKIDPNEIR